MIGGGIRRVSKTKVVVAGSTGVHIRLIMRRVYIREYGVVGVHIRVHRLMKVNRFIICRVISHCTTRRLDNKGGRRRRERRKSRNIGSSMGVIRLIR